MRKLLSMLATTVLAAAIGNVYAADENSCPSVWTLRDSGSTFTHAFHSPSGSGKNSDTWIVVSDPFL